MPRIFGFGPSRARPLQPPTWSVLFDDDEELGEPYHVSLGYVYKNADLRSGPWSTLAPEMVF